MSVNLGENVSVFGKCLYLHIYTFNDKIAVATLTYHSSLYGVISIVIVAQVINYTYIN